ncbi:uncharacterized protein LOC124451114 isoform X2 [Xenia sp. Carnegie-2017]|uniref:uncharacterized protein LOC124451114 isoform X2 n=1 Tax=Xenia sp. Carnegie-2017 TaxID=2897299 RepID=UPI001F04D345|nr:uncharacterized protein LOC124451114 isoform X2 [Xenia sp. Carnegie-2017]
MPPLTTKQKIAIGLSVPIVGLLFYFVLKWARENDEEDDENYTEETVVSSADLTSELTIQQQHVGAVIGHAGNVIKQIQKDSGTRINLKDNEEGCEDEFMEEERPIFRTIVVRGSREGIKHAEVLIKQIIAEQPVKEKIRVDVPQYLIGRIIGKGGKTIRQLCRTSGARIEIGNENKASDTRTCIISGTQTEIDCAKQLINEKIMEEKEFRARKKKPDLGRLKTSHARIAILNDYFKVYVSAIESPEKFWIQNVTEDAKLLDHLIEEMTSYYGEKCQGYQLTQPAVGDLCCAMFKHDSSWYRAKIIQINKDEVHLHYVDFGDKDILPLSCVKIMRHEFSDLPFQAIEVKLANVQPIGDKWSTKACDEFVKLTYCAQWKVLMAKVLFYDDNSTPCVEIIDTNTEQDVNIEQKLVEGGFAVYKGFSNDDDKKMCQARKSTSDFVVEKHVEPTSSIVVEKHVEPTSSIVVEKHVEPTSSIVVEKHVEPTSSIVVEKHVEPTSSIVVEKHVEPTSSIVVEKHVEPTSSIVVEKHVEPTSSIVVEQITEPKIDVVVEQITEQKETTSETLNVDFKLSESNDIHQKEKVKSNVDISQLESLFGMVSLNASATDGIDVGDGKEGVVVKGGDEDDSEKNNDGESLDRSKDMSLFTNEKNTQEQTFYKQVDIKFPVDSDYQHIITTSEVKDFLEESGDDNENANTTSSRMTSSLPYNKHINKDTQVLKVNDVASTSESVKQSNIVEKMNNSTDVIESGERNSHDVVDGQNLNLRPLMQSNLESDVSSRTNQHIQSSLPGNSHALTKGSKRVMAANFSVDTKTDSESEEGDSSLYLSAREDSDSTTGFESALGSTDNSRMTPAAHAAKNGHVNCLKWLVEETKAYVELAVQDGETHLLHYSAAEGVEQCLNYLLTFMKKRKITTDIIDGYGQSPLHTASKMGHLACVQTLVEHGSDVLAKDNEGLTSANIAYINKHSLCSRYLLMAECTWILASRVATLFREVNVVKKENKELKKSLENMKSRKKSFPKDLPHRPETVGAHVDESGKQIEESSLSHIKSNLRERKFPDGESPKNTFTEADKRRPQHFIPSSHVISKDWEISDKKNFKVIRQSGNNSDSIPFVSIYGIAELNPSEKVKAKEIAMVTHQLLSTRHLQLVKKKKNEDVNPAKAVDPVIAEHKSTTSSVDDSAVVLRRATLRNKSNRPKSLCDKDLKFMRSASDVGFSRNVTSFGPLERTISCTEISTQSKFTEDVDKNSSSDLELSKNDSDGKIWENVGARKLLSRKKNSKPRPLSAGLTDLQTVSTDKILELYARESRGSSSRLNSLIKEEDENSMGLRTISSLELKSSYSLEESNKPSDVEALNNIEKNKGSVSNTTNSTNVNTETKVKKRPVAKPRQKRPVSSNQTKNSIQTSKDNVHFDSHGFNAKLDETNIGFTDV